MPIKTSDMHSLLSKWANGNQEAAEFLANIAAMARLADNIADGDSEDTAADVGHLLHRALITNTENRFFRENRVVLTPVMANAILMWVKSEQWRKSDNRKTRMFAFVYREGVEHLAHITAFLTGGIAHAAEVMEDLHKRSHQSSDEAFEDWEKE